MHFSKSLLAAAVSAAPALAFEVNTYWGQVGVGDTLGEYCESSSIDYVTLAFVNNSPENGNGTHYPGTNFAAHCASDVYVVEGRNSKLLSGCSFIKDDIKKCKGLGKKILLSIGGEMNSISNYTVSTVEEGEYFAKFMFDAFGPYQQGSNGPRPFDISDTEHTFVDGFDFDIEYKFENQDPYIAMIQKLRLLTIGCGEDIILTAAPQCPLSEEYMQMKDILEGVAFDKIWIQFYNNPVCDATGSGFNYADWVQYLSGTVNFDAELFVGLPATKGSSGYITPDAAKTLICNTRSSDKFGGIMLWDAYSASQNVNQDGKTYYECIHEALHGCWYHLIKLHYVCYHLFQQLSVVVYREHDFQQLSVFVYREHDFQLYDDRVRFIYCEQLLGLKLCDDLLSIFVNNLLLQRQLNQLPSLKLCDNLLSIFINNLLLQGQLNQLFR
ncbi:glycoside hydrolase superfamily [Xylariales sp. AK1849]|nr:glycoside hydrolase superfamily [Xylariales sp. AK1849]